MEEEAVVSGVAEEDGVEDSEVGEGEDEGDTTRDHQRESSLLVSCLTPAKTTSC